MKTSLLDGLNAKDKEEMTGLFIAALRLRKRYGELIEKKIETNNAMRVSTNAYDSPSWAFQQADRNGYERAMKEIISLLTD